MFTLFISGVVAIVVVDMGVHPRMEGGRVSISTVVPNQWMLGDVESVTSSSLLLRLGFYGFSVRKCGI